MTEALGKLNHSSQAETWLWGEQGHLVLLKASGSQGQIR